MPSTLANIAMAIPLVFGGHEAGHFKAGREAGVSMTMKKNGFFAHTNDSNKLAKVFGGGFEGQDLAVALMGDTKAARGISGLNKIGYSLFPKGLTPGVEGDVALMGREKGKSAKRVMQASLMISGISDMLKAFGKGLPDNQDLKFMTTHTGAPGLMYSRRF